MRQIFHRNDCKEIDFQKKKNKAFTLRCHQKTTLKIIILKNKAKIRFIFFICLWNVFLPWIKFRFVLLPVYQTSEIVCQQLSKIETKRPNLFVSRITFVFLFFLIFSVWLSRISKEWNCLIVLSTSFSSAVQTLKRKQSPWKVSLARLLIWLCSFCFRFKTMTSVHCVLREFVLKPKAKALSVANVTKNIRRGKWHKYWQ